MLFTLDHEQPGYYQQSLKEDLVSFGHKILPHVWHARTQASAKRLLRDMQIFDEVLQVISAKLDVDILLQTIAKTFAGRFLLHFPSYKIGCSR
jgi:hypothetical protein